MSEKKVTKQKAKPVDRATPFIRKPKSTDAEKISVTRGVTSTMKNAPQYGSSPELQAVVQVWNQAADAVESNAKVITTARHALAALEATQCANRQAWATATKRVTASVAGISQGSSDVVHALGLDVLTHVGPIAQDVAPSGLNAKPGTVSGEAVISWQKGTARWGFLVQRATDPANGATWAAAIPCTKPKYKVEGEKPSSTVYFRVAAIDATKSSGLGPWSDWLACTVR